MQNVKISYFEFENNIFKLINKYYFTKYEKSYGVAVSGGPDSMLLLYILSKWAISENKILKVFSFNHNLRPESIKEILLVKGVCKKLGCDFIEIKWDEKPNTAIMQKARVARYSQVAQKCHAFNIKTLFLGHHADDIAETLSMRIFKNSSLEGLCPMFEVREIFNIKLFRPFLKIYKDQILQFNLLNKIKYISDPSNSNNKYFRSRIRNLLNNEKKLKSNLIRASILFCKIRKFNHRFVKYQLEDLYTYKREGFMIINRDIFNKYPKFLIISFLKTVISRIGSKTYYSKSEVLSNIYSRAYKKENFILSLRGCILEFKNRSISIVREHNDICNKEKLIKKNTKYVWDNRFEIINRSSFSVKVLTAYKVLNNSFYVKKFKLNKKKIKTLPFKVRKTIPAIITLEGFMYIPHLNICELKKLKNSIECHTIDFFHKKYDNII